MNKELRKAIYTRSHLRNKFFQQLTKEGVRKSDNIYLKGITRKGLTANENFWKFNKPFQTIEVFLESNDITLKGKTLLVTDEAKYSDNFNNY